MQKVSFQKSRRKLLMLWLIMSVIVILVFFIQTLTGKYTSHVKEVWQWLFQFILPALTLMLGVFISQSMSTTDDSEVDQFYYRLSMGISGFFLFILMLAPLIIPLLHLSNNGENIAIDEQHNILDSFKTFDYFILPLQGITMLSLGLFFTKNKA